MFYQEGDAVLSVLRIPQGRAESGTSIALCIRHVFLRDYLYGSVLKSHSIKERDYPFKERGSTLTLESLGNWKYFPTSIEHPSSHQNVLWHGTLHPDVIIQELQEIVSNTLSGGMELLRRLTPEESLRQIEVNGENSWCEKMWMEDYQKAISNK
jgi:hypothetical protein